MAPLVSELVFEGLMCKRDDFFDRKLLRKTMASRLSQFGWLTLLYIVGKTLKIFFSTANACNIEQDYLLCTASISSMKHRLT
jgi:hypothetical protein